MYNRTNTDGYPRCGEIWMCELSSKESGIQSGYRPVFILSNNINNTYAPTLNVVPLTTKMNKRRLPIHVELWDYEKYGLKRPSTLLIEQITTVPMVKLDKHIGNIEDLEVLENIVQAISIQFPIVQMLDICQR